MYCKFVFLSDKVIVSDCNDDNSEVVPYLKDVKLNADSSEFVYKGAKYKIDKKGSATRI